MLLQMLTAIGGSNMKVGIGRAVGIGLWVTVVSKIAKKNAWCILHVPESTIILKLIGGVKVHYVFCMEVGQEKSSTLITVQEPIISVSSELVSIQVISLKVSVITTSTFWSVLRVDMSMNTFQSHSLPLTMVHSYSHSRSQICLVISPVLAVGDNVYGYNMLIFYHCDAAYLELNWVKNAK